MKQIDDQDSTDFMKCLNYVEELEKERNVKVSKTSILRALKKAAAFNRNNRAHA